MLARQKDETENVHDREGQCRKHAVETLNRAWIQQKASRKPARKRQITYNTPPSPGQNTDCQPGAPPAFFLSFSMVLFFLFRARPPPHFPLFSFPVSFPLLFFSFRPRFGWEKSDPTFFFFSFIGLLPPPPSFCFSLFSPLSSLPLPFSIISSHVVLQSLSRTRQKRLKA